ncbi:gephyrin-like molybdotransferase Glp [Neorhizobium tomejilense]|uniref:molybdopterin molybdotransferase MoeA n=1 Tax=Neorhizobium tomejilense TaxID=2093828 RepID=UPI001FDF33C5|nr:gephyrin-like molybdotransferase Glp [Neorhizobium tomejilense]
MSLITAVEECGGVGAERAAPLPFDVAVKVAIGAALPTGGAELAPLHASIGRILASDINSPLCLPLFDHSAMDGYAVRTIDLNGSGPWMLEMRHRILAGDPPASIPVVGTCVEIYTGAPVPEGFDAVVIRERCVVAGDTVLITGSARVGENIRRRGEDISEGMKVASSGQPVTTHVAAMLAALGVGSVQVRTRVRVALLTTGSELVRTGEVLLPGQIYDSNSVMAAATLSLPWIELSDLGHIPDDLGAITEAVRDASQNYDVILTSGGMSHGAADHMRAALAENGARLDVMQVAMRPGKPATIGRLGNALFIGLPGNPMAAAVVLRQIALPAIRKTAGFQKVESGWIRAVASFEYRKREGRTEFVPVRIAGTDASGRPLLEILGRGSSGSLLPMAISDGVAMLGSEDAEIHRGQELRFEPFHITDGF